MSVSNRKPLKPIVPHVAMTVQVPVARGLEVDAIADALGISRHKLLLRAIAIGLPVVAAAASAPKAADPPQSA